METINYLPRIVEHILPKIKESADLKTNCHFYTGQDGFSYYALENGDGYIFAMKWNGNGKVELRASVWITARYLYYLFRKEFGDDVIQAI